MKRVAAFDASTWWGGVALVESDGESGCNLIAEWGLHVTDSHAAHLLQGLEHLLQQAGWERGTLDAFAAARGPGAFTGVRVALGTVRGLALAAGRACVGVDTLQALAEASGPAEADRVPLLDAGRGEVYGARYDAAGSPPVELRAPWLGPPEQVLEQGAGGGAVLIGPGAELTGTTLARVGWSGTFRRLPTSVAAGVGRIALSRLAQGDTGEDGMSPLYLRPPDAVLKAPSQPRGG